MPSVNGNIEIGKNYMRYNDEILKISNISRTWIFRFQNRERIAYQNAKQAYEEAKQRYIKRETDQKNETKKKYIIATVIIFLVSMFSFSLSASFGMMLFVVAAICGYMAYRTAQKNIVYDVPPPQEQPFPDKYGLGIEMNSNYSVFFTAVGYDGVRSLRKLQEEINDADTQGETTVFNMNENHISVENNEGIISTGDNADNTLEENKQSSTKKNEETVNTEDGIHNAAENNEQTDPPSKNTDNTMKQKEVSKV